MSALAMILMTAMVVPGNGPKMESGEIVQEPQRLDLSGEWEGAWWDNEGKVWKLELSEGALRGTSDKEVTTPLSIAFIIDEDHGRLRIDWPFPSDSLGIYKQEGDRVEIYCRERCQGRPTSFHAGNGQNLLILHRVKPRM